MPVLRSIRERFARERPLDGRRASAACLHVTAETANLVRDAGRRRRARSRCAPPTRCPRRTTSRRRWPSDDGAEVHARRGEDARRLRRPRRARVRRPRARRSRSTTAPTCSSTLHAARPRPARAAARRHRGDDHRPACACARWRPTGGWRARSSPSTRRAPSASFNDRYGTGQSALDGILRATNLLLAGQHRRRARLRLDRPRHRAARARRRRAGRSSARSTRCARSRRGWRASR